MTSIFTPYVQRGFDLVTSESPLHMMFTPQELEMLICGEKVIETIV